MKKNLLLILLSLVATLPTTAQGRTTVTSFPEPEKTAIVIIDMWNTHWCMTFAQRTSSLVPRMNAVLDIARNLGMQVIWNPTDVVTAYSGYPQYEKAVSTVSRKTPEVRDDLDVHFSAPGGGCVCGPGFACGLNYGWDGMHPDLIINDNDLISSSTDEIYTLLADRGITNVIYMGVATNMCVYGKPGALSFLWRAGFNCMLASDLSDAITLYDPASGYTPDKGSEETNGNMQAAGIPIINMGEVFRAAGLWKLTAPVDYVRFTPWGQPDRPYLTENATLVTLTAPLTDGSEIRYTTDGSEPTMNTTLFTAPVRVEQTTTLRATAFRKGQAVSLPSFSSYVMMNTAVPPRPDVYLDDMEYIPNSYLKSWDKAIWYPAKGKSFEGKPLRLKNTTYTHGIGFRAPSAVQYEIKPEYDRFVALAGIDENMLSVDNGRFVAHLSSVVFRIVIDGAPVAESPVMRISQEPWRFVVAIPAGSRRIDVVCMDAGSRNILDYGNWVDAGFILKKTETRGVSDLILPN